MSCERACVTAQCGARCGSAEKCAASEQSSSFNAERARRGVLQKSDAFFACFALQLAAGPGRAAAACYLLDDASASLRSSICVYLQRTSHGVKISTSDQR